MSENRPPEDEDAETVRRAESDVTAELERVASAEEDPVEAVEDLVLHPPELDYLQAGLTSLREALRGASAPEESENS